MEREHQRASSYRRRNPLEAAVRAAIHDIDDSHAQIKREAEAAADNGNGASEHTERALGAAVSALIDKGPERYS